jgi:hypothetical protein
MDRGSPKLHAVAKGTGDAPVKTTNGPAVAKIRTVRKRAMGAERPASEVRDAWIDQDGAKYEHGANRACGVGALFVGVAAVGLAVGIRLAAGVGDHRPAAATAKRERLERVNTLVAITTTFTSPASLGRFSACTRARLIELPE